MEKKGSKAPGDIRVEPERVGYPPDRKNEARGLEWALRLACLCGRKRLGWPGHGMRRERGLVMGVEVVLNRFKLYKDEDVSCLSGKTDLGVNNGGRGPGKR